MHLQCQYSFRNHLLGYIDALNLLLEKLVDHDNGLQPIDYYSIELREVTQNENLYQQKVEPYHKDLLSPDLLPLIRKSATCSALFHLD